MTTKTERLRALCEEVKQWGNCNQAWLDQSEDVPAAVVGHIDEDGNAYPVVLIDCDQYYAAQDSIKLARHYAALNPAEVRAMLDLMGKMRDAMRTVIKATHSHIDGRDLLAELHPRHMMDIKVRREGKDLWFEGDWLSTLWDDMKTLREALEASDLWNKGE